MAIFVLGRSGSGKSTAAHQITEEARFRGLSAERINDFPILKSMFLADRQHKQFLPTPQGGFEFTDPSVMDIALQRVEGKAKQRQVSGIQVVTIEFARTNYEQALKQFSKEFIDSSYVLFLDADIETCLDRIHQRVANPQSEDDHPVESDELFRRRYAYDNRLYMQHGFKEDFPATRSGFIDTETITLEDFRDQLHDIAGELFVPMNVETQAPPQPLGLVAKRYF